MHMYAAFLQQAASSVLGLISTSCARSSFQTSSFDWTILTHTCALMETIPSLALLINSKNGNVVENDTARAISNLKQNISVECKCFKLEYIRSRVILRLILQRFECSPPKKSRWSYMIRAFSYACFISLLTQCTGTDIGLSRYLSFLKYFLTYRYPNS